MHVTAAWASATGGLRLAGSLRASPSFSHQCLHVMSLEINQKNDFQLLVPELLRPMCDQMNRTEPNHNVRYCTTINVVMGAQTYLASIYVCSHQY